MIYKTRPTKTEYVDAIEVRVEGERRMAWTEANGALQQMERSAFLNLFEPAKRKPKAAEVKPATPRKKKEVTNV